MIPFLCLTTIIAMTRQMSKLLKDLATITDRNGFGSMDFTLLQCAILIKALRKTSWLHFIKTMLDIYIAMTGEAFLN